jgi:hypothetical protein
MSKHRRAGKAAWFVISKLDPGALALVELSQPIAIDVLETLLCSIELKGIGVFYQQHVWEAFGYIFEFLKEKQPTLFNQFSALLQNIRNELLKAARAESKHHLGESHCRPTNGLDSQDIWASHKEHQLIHFCR